jgi:Zn-dependent peptidase ImmA (M78 family)
MTAPGTWEEMLDEAEALGFRVEIVEYCESADSPGLLGAALGVCVHDKKLIRLREKLNLADRCFVLRHELEHAAAGKGPHNAQIDERWHTEYAAEIDAVSDRVYG